MAEQPLICYVEIPKGSRNKYEYDSDLGALVLDRFLLSSLFSVYKDLEQKTVTVDGWYSREDALAEIESARQRRAEGAYR